jgi:TIR domain-containing protein
MPDGPEVFISYRVLDNHPPPDGPARGFVDYLLTQIRYDLTQLGIPDAILWQDRSKIAPADDWNDNILSALNSAQLFIAILSKNYITSDWCNKELDTMTSRVETLDARARERRIFRVDKHKVPENKVPISLRTVQSVQFYREDRYSDSVDEYFWRGKVRYIDEYEGAVKKLAQGICSRLEELGIQCQPKEQPKSRVESARPSNGRVVFVAQPAFDMVQPYRTLVKELQDAGFRVTPDPDKDVVNLGDEIRPAVVKALGEAEASIHLLGARTGGRPDGLEMDFGPMQLATAADEAKKRPKFERLIWAPIILPSGTSDEAKIARDPLEILGRFGQRLLETDQIDGDTASRFNEFVLQRLGRTPSEPSTEREVDRKIVYIRPGSNRKFAVEIAKELKQVGFNPVLNPPPPLFGQPQHIVVLWGSQSQAKLLEEISAIDSSRKAAQPAGGQLILLVTSPPTKSKSEVLIIGMPYVDHIIDATECEDAVSVGEKLASALGGVYGLLGGKR